jgi:hypothetical protein
MSTLVRDLFRQASELDAHDRATLAGLLLESLEYTGIFPVPCSRV